MPATAPLDDNVASTVERRLVGIAQSFDAALRDRVTLLLTAAAQAIVQLADLDLVQFEAGQEQGGHTLALWEDLAPVMSGTVKQVNEVIAGATTQFPPPAEDESLDDLDAAFAPSANAQAKEEGAPKSTAEETASLVAAVCSGMRRDVTRLGDRLRNPTVMGIPGCSSRTCSSSAGASVWRSGN